jgi:hypothetical protein
MLLKNTAHGADVAKFLTVQTQYKGILTIRYGVDCARNHALLPAINKDQWTGIWEFCRNVDAKFVGN